MASRVFKKSWPNYLKPAFLILAALILVYLFSWSSENVNFLGLPKQLIIFTMVVAFGLSTRALYIIAHLRSYKLSINAKGIHASYGVLPWKKVDKLWEPDQIYSVESQIPKFAFFHWLVRHGNLTIRGKEGSTEGSLFTFISQAKEAAKMGNAIRYKAYKQGEHENSAIQKPKTNSVLTSEISEMNKSREGQETTYTSTGPARAKWVQTETSFVGMTGAALVSQFGSVKKCEKEIKLLGYRKVKGPSTSQGLTWEREAVWAERSYLKVPNEARSIAVIDVASGTDMKLWEITAIFWDKDGTRISNLAAGESSN